jgi:hypothetical protein
MTTSMFLRRLKGLSLAPLLLSALALAQTDASQDASNRQLSATETQQQSRDYMTKMQDTQVRVQKLHDEASKKKDIIKLNCVNDKLIQLKGHLTVADQTMGQLNVALQRSDTGARQHEFTRLTIIYQKVLVLGTEAENCIGADVSYVGPTKVDVDIDPTIPADDPTQPQLPLPDPTRPAEATPFT